MKRVNGSVINIEATVLPKEKKWIKILADGKTTYDLAKEIGINENTLAYHLKEIRIKYGCANTTQLVAYFIRNKLID